MAKPSKFDVRKIVSLSAEMAEAISNVRFEDRFPTEADAIRQLLKEALDARLEGRARKDRKLKDGGSR